MPLTNTLETARRMEALGFTHKQAQGIAEILETTAMDAQPDLGELATKADLAALKAELTADIQALRAELKADLSSLESRLMREMRQQMLWFFATQVALISAAFALFKLLG
jgi:hypothetical protein